MAASPAELLETRIFAQRIPERIDLNIAASFAIGHFEQMGQGRDRRIDVANLRLDGRQRDLCKGFARASLS